MQHSFISIGVVSNEWTAKRLEAIVISRLIDQKIYADSLLGI